MSKRRVISSLLAMGLVLSMFASASAFHGDAPEGGEWQGDESSAHAYFPWVPNGTDDLDGLGPFYGTITIQNLESEFAVNDGVAEVDIYVGQDGGGWELEETVELQPKESITLDADVLNIPEGEGAPVAAAGVLERGEDEVTETCGDIADPPDYGDAYDAGCDVVFNPDTDERELVDPDQEVVTEDAVDAVYARIAGVAKNVSPVEGVSAQTTAAHNSVDGYSALTGQQVIQDLQPDWGADGTYILPIAQNNAGWNTVLRVANLNESGGLTNVSVTFYGSGQQGFAGESEVVNLQLRAGEVASVDISDHVADDWVGSAFITSSADIGAIAERYKVSDDMLITNSSRPEHHEDTTKFGALVFKEYNFWNTGISVANVDDDDHNSVTIYYVGPTNNIVGQDTLTVPPRGMEFIYTPGSQDLGLEDGFVGSVIIEGSRELHASIDQVKYFGNDPDVGQAMSYVAEAERDAAGPFQQLSMPLVQKGNPNTGLGDTSGVQLFNPSSNNAIDGEIVFYGANGLPVAPTVENNDPDPISISVPAHGNYTLYTHGQSEMSSGFQGSVVVSAFPPGRGPAGFLVGVSNNVNYEVDGDGSVAFPMVQSFGEQSFSD